MVSIELGTNEAFSKQQPLQSQHLAPANTSLYGHTLLATGNIFVRIFSCKTLNLIAKQLKEKGGGFIDSAIWLTQGGTDLGTQLGSFWSLSPPPPSFSPLGLDLGLPSWMGGRGGGEEFVLWPTTILGLYYLTELAKCMSSKIINGQKAPETNLRRIRGEITVWAQFFPRCKRARGQGSLPRHSELALCTQPLWPPSREKKRDIAAACLQ